MSSSRFPGKVLAPFHGIPLIRHILTVCSAKYSTVLLTSVEVSDDPLAEYVEVLGNDVYRGDLENVLGRFQNALNEYPCDAVFRVCADSPYVNVELMESMAELFRPTHTDLITNTFPRSFPVGRSLELINANTLRALDSRSMEVDEKEHVTRHFYKHPDRFKILNLQNERLDVSHSSLAIDTIEDLRRIEQIRPTELPGLGIHQSGRQIGVGV
ncbi:NTP transferase domain-containing protein [bacterium]|nr:NTP transferase domain-containing protein [bacterium]